MWQNLLPGADPIHKVSIIPRGPALAIYTSASHGRQVSDHEAGDKGKLTVLMGGRVAEEIMFNEITTGAQNDLAKATQLAHKMVTEFGMSEKIGPLSLKRPDEEIFLGRDITREPRYSDNTSQIIDEEVKRIVEGAKDAAGKILKANMDKLKTLAERLLEKEILDGEEVDRIMKGEPEPVNHKVSVERT